MSSVWVGSDGLHYVDICHCARTCVIHVQCSVSVQNIPPLGPDVVGPRPFDLETMFKHR